MDTFRSGEIAPEQFILQEFLKAKRKQLYLHGEAVPHHQCC